MKKRKRKMLYLFLMLLLSVLSLTGVTYAWFSQGENASVNQFQMDVESVSGLELSRDGSHWYHELTGISFSGTLTPVSTIGDIDSSTKSIKFFKGTFDNNTLKNVVAATESIDGNVKGYYALTLYVRNTGEEDINVTLSDGNEHVTKVLCSDDYEDEPTYSSLAARIAFQNRGEVATGSTSAQITGLVNNTGNVSIFEPNATVHTQDAISAGKATSNARTSYYGLKGTGTGPYNLDTPTTYTTVFAQASTVSDPEEMMFEISADSIACVTIYIWIEGQDCDCTNYVAGKDLYVNLKFSRDVQ